MKPKLNSKRWGVSPNNAEAECSVLGSIMIEPDSLNAVTAFLKPEDFFDSSRALIYSVMISLQSSGRPTDTLTLAEELERRGKFQEIGGVEVLTKLLETVPNASHVEYYGRMVREDAVRRRLVQQGMELADRANSKANLSELRPMLSALAESVIDIDETAIHSDGSKVSSSEAGGFVRFPIEALPWPLDRFLIEAAASLRCDPCYIALPMLSILAGAVGNTRVIQLKRKWSEPCLFWTVIVSPSGTMKSPAWSMAKEPLDVVQSAAFKVYREAKQLFDQQQREYDLAVKDWKRSGSQQADGMPIQPIEPIAERYLVDDVTVETLAPLLEQQPRGLVLAVDELAGWFGAFNQYRSGRGSDVERWLSIHRAGPITVDRKTGHQCRHIPRACISIGGGVQPKVMARILGNAEFRENGLMARLLLAMPPRQAKQWSEADVSEDSDVAYRHIVERLLSLDFGADESGNPVPVALPLSPEAKAKFVRFFNAHNREQSLLSDDLSAAWSKLEAYAPRLALLTHLIRWAAEGYTPANTNPVDAQSMEAGIVLVKWFANEAKRLYAILGSGNDSEESQRRRLASEAAQQQGGRLTVRDLMRLRAEFSKSADVAKKTLNALVAAGLGRWEQSSPSKSGGRPSSPVFVFTDSANSPDKTQLTTDGTLTNPASGDVSSMSANNDTAA